MSSSATKLAAALPPTPGEIEAGRRKLRVLSRKLPPAVREAFRYAERVVDSKEVAGELARLACERHWTDLERQKARGLYFALRPDGARSCRMAGMGRGVLPDSLPILRK
jgi:hypothetical protein